MQLEQVGAYLETVAKGRVFFGHQSVGRDILAGVASLAREAGVPLRIQEICESSVDPGLGLLHANVGQNGLPGTKIDAFLSHATRLEQTGLDAALLKFCYVDLGEGSSEQSPSRLFSSYATATEKWHARRPEVSLIHTTMPLMSEPLSWKTRVRRLMGRPTWTDAGNRSRGEYNQLVRSQMTGQTIFDIARVEATRTDGSISSFDAGDQFFETLATEYTTDGGHLNDLGQRRVAGEFLRVLAEALRG